MVPMGSWYPNVSRSEVLFWFIYGNIGPFWPIYGNITFKSSCLISTIELSFRPFLSQVKPLIIPEVDIIRVHTPCCGFKDPPTKHGITTYDALNINKGYSWSTCTSCSREGALQLIGHLPFPHTRLLAGWRQRRAPWICYHSWAAWRKHHRRKGRPWGSVVDPSSVIGYLHYIRRTSSPM